MKMKDKDIGYLEMIWLMQYPIFKIITEAKNKYNVEDDPYAQNILDNSRFVLGCPFDIVTKCLGQILIKHEHDQIFVLDEPTTQWEDHQKYNVEMSERELSALWVRHGVEHAAKILFVECSHCTNEDHTGIFVKFEKKDEAMKEVEKPHSLWKPVAKMDTNKRCLKCGMKIMSILDCQRDWRKNLKAGTQ